MSTPVAVTVEPGSHVDLDLWAREHAAGLRADASPYGLDLLSVPGVRTVATRPLGPVRTRLAASVVRHARIDPAAVLRRPRGDVVLTQHEKIGVPAVLASRLPGRPPVVTGVIWLTDDTADVPAPLRRALVRVLGRAAAVFVLSPAQVPLVEAWGVAPRRVRFVPFGVDADFWTPDGAPEPGLVLSAGTDRDRDHATLLAALAGGRLQLAGGQDLPPSPGLELLGRLSHSQLREAYRRAAVVAVATRPNVHVSGVTVVLEAMACGRPVVVTATDGMEAYVQDGVTGVLVPPGDVAALREEVRALLADPDRARRLGAAARRSVCERFTSTHYARALGRLCRDVAGVAR